MRSLHKERDVYSSGGAFLLTPAFSPVTEAENENWKPFKRFPNLRQVLLPTALKRSVNERVFVRNSLRLVDDVVGDVADNRQLKLLSLISFDCGENQPDKHSNRNQPENQPDDHYQ